MKRLLPLFALHIVVMLAGCDAFNKKYYDAIFVAVNSGEQTGYISGETFLVAPKQWVPLDDEISPGEEVLLRDIGLSEDGSVDDVFRGLTVSPLGGGPSVDAMPDSIWTKVEDREGHLTFTLDVGPLVAPR